MQDSEVLWGLYQEHITQGRHHEEQRATVTNLIIAIGGAALGLVALDNQLTTADLPLAVFVIIIGLYGALFSAKQYERYSAHMERAREFRDALEGLLPNTQIKSRKQTADARARQKFPRLSGLRLFWLWILLHLLVASIGGIMAVKVIWFS